MRILLVEDEHRIAAAIKKGLEQERYATDVVYDGEHGLSMAIAEDYDLIILDRMLPQLDGIEVCKQLRAKKIHTPILMLTAKTQINDRVTGLDAGADDYLIKPFAFEELLARIRALIRRPQQTIETQLEVEDLSIDPKLFAVHRGNKPIKLSSKEFSLLEYMVRNANKIVTKDQIIRHVWDYDADVLPNTVEVYIRNLRKKIDEPFHKKTPLLQTVRGFGYKLGT
jgi:DNA-binding response OmpR family regulator